MIFSWIIIEFTITTAFFFYSIHYSSALKIDTNCSLSRPSSNITMTTTFFFCYLLSFHITIIHYPTSSSWQPYLINLFVILEEHHQYDQFLLFNPFNITAVLFVLSVILQHMSNIIVFLLLFTAITTITVFLLSKAR